MHRISIYPVMNYWAAHLDSIWATHSTRLWCIELLSRLRAHYNLRHRLGVFSPSNGKKTNKGGQRTSLFFALPGDVEVQSRLFFCRFRGPRYSLDPSVFIGTVRTSILFLRGAILAPWRRSRIVFHFVAVFPSSMLHRCFIHELQTWVDMDSPRSAESWRLRGVSVCWMCLTPYINTHTCTCPLIAAMCECNRIATAPSSGLHYNTAEWY